jgi:DNA-binding NarL/FixJ family response regulator
MAGGEPALRGRDVNDMADPITVVLVEDHVALRKGMELLLGRRGHVIVGSVGDAPAAYELMRTRSSDVAVIDISLPSESGADLTRRLSRENPNLRVLLYTGIEDCRTIGDALDCGARGFALKAGAPEELTGAIRTLADGGTYLDPRLGPMLAGSTSEPAHVLSPREREILDLLAQGLTGAAAARRLYLSPDTVRTHVRNAMAKLRARTRVEAVVLALDQRAIRSGERYSSQTATAATVRPGGTRRARGDLHGDDG